jgi:hypothetical protein
VIQKSSSCNKKSKPQKNFQFISCKKSKPQKKFPDKPKFYLAKKPQPIPKITRYSGKINPKKTQPMAKFSSRSQIQPHTRPAHIKNFLTFTNSTLPKL